MGNDGFEFERPRTFEQMLEETSRSDFAEEVEKANEERRQIRERYPLEEWPEMPLEEYALGQDDRDETYCWWLEFNSPNLGSISGGSARKHLVYNRSSEPGWYYPDEYDNAEEAWEAIRAAFLRAFGLAEDGDIEAIDDIEQLSSGGTVTSKTITVYFPGEKLAIHSKRHLRHFLDKLGLEEAYSRADGPFRLNKLLLDELRSYPALADWSVKELERFLYTWAHPDETSRVVKIAPGDQAKLWEDCLENNYIRVGWDETGDLKDYESKSPFKKEFERLYHDKHSGHGPTLSKKANEVWTLRELKPGDVVVANKGKSEVLAVGRVVDPGYRWLGDYDDYNHAVAVDWDTSYAQKLPTQERWGMVTVADISSDLYRKILEDSSDTVVIPSDQSFDRISDALEAKGQAILYGPPGTGKTYTARRFAVWWLSKRLSEESEAFSRALATAESIDAVEEMLVTGHEAPLHDGPGPKASTSQQVGPLTPLTFHPSYTYEDFVEGFKPGESNDGSIDLELTDGAFKRVCRAAKENPDRPYLLLIDEINRANLNKVFGELITLLEKDKRGMTVELPQSGEAFEIPPNVYILGTMNTVDRSLRHLDAALRRRFRFLEMMPEFELLHGATVGDLQVDEFLRELNQRVVAREGREKQIGHSYLMVDGTAVSEPEDFAVLFRYEILPLLQEYCYDDFNALADYVGSEIVDPATRSFNEDLLDDANALVEVLADEFHGGAAQ